MSILEERKNHEMHQQVPSIFSSQVPFLFHKLKSSAMLFLSEIQTLAKPALHEGMMPLESLPSRYLTANIAISR